MSATVERGRSLQESVSCPASARSTRFPKPFLMVSSIRGSASPLGCGAGDGGGRTHVAHALVVRSLATRPREEGNNWKKASRVGA